MEMIIEIYKNNEKVNEIQSTDPTEIYKKIAQIFYTKETKRATKTIINRLNDNIKITQIFDQYKTMLENTTYTYKYYFDGVEL